MKIKLIQKSIFTAMLLSTSFFALAASQQVLCPPVDLIKRSTSELNTVSYMGGKYAVWSLNYAFNNTNVNWQVMSYTAASDFNAAFVIGQNNVSSVNKQIDKYAKETNDFYFCHYSGSQDVVAAISFKDENEKFKLGSMDLNVLDSNSH